MIWGTTQVKASEQHSTVSNLDLTQFYPKIDDFLSQINQIILDKSHQTKLALCSLLAGGHLLFEDLPGLGKTTLASSLSRLAGLDFQRIQFTNDMLASDVIGINMFNQKEHQFSLNMVQSLPKFCSQMKLTAVALKPKVLCLKQWRRAMSL